MGTKLAGGWRRRVAGWQEGREVHGNRADRRQEAGHSACVPEAVGARGRRVLRWRRRRRARCETSGYGSRLPRVPDPLGGPARAGVASPCLDLAPAAFPVVRDDLPEYGGEGPGRVPPPP